MTDPRRFGLLELLLALVVLAVAGAARGWYLSACTVGDTADSPLHVQSSGHSAGSTFLQTAGERQR